jgi:hypothetical protein
LNRPGGTGWPVRIRASCHEGDAPSGHRPPRRHRARHPGDSEDVSDPGRDGGDRGLHDELVAELQVVVEGRIDQEVHRIEHLRGGGDLGMPRYPGGQIAGAGWHRVGIEKCSHPGLLDDEEVRIRGSEPVGAEGLVGDQEGVGESVVHPGRVTGVVGVVPDPPAGDAGHDPMDATHLGHGSLHLRHRPIGGGRDVRGGPGETAERVLAVARVITHSGHHLGMGGLDQQRSDPTDEGGGIADDPPGHGARAEQAGVTLVVEAAGQRVGGMAER